MGIGMAHHLLTRAHIHAPHAPPPLHTRARITDFNINFKRCNGPCADAQSACNPRAVRPPDAVANLACAEEHAAAVPQWGPCAMRGQNPSRAQQEGARLSPNATHGPAGVAWHGWCSKEGS